MLAATLPRRTRREFMLRKIGAAALISSAALFGLYQVPVGAVLSAPDGSLRLLLYEAFGAYLAFLYQRSGGSLPLVAIAHCTCSLIVAALAAAQVGSTLPFV